MVIKSFPPIEAADSSGLLALGGDLEVDSLVLAYRSGIFPWPIHDGILAWFAPPKRAILELNDFHLSSRDQRALRASNFKIRCNTNFRQVISRCAGADNRSGQGGTWITPEMVEAYCTLHKSGLAYCVEAWLGCELVGGLYGVSIGGMVAAESMFYSVSNSSKACMAWLVERCKGLGIRWIDIQVINPHTRRLGGREITRRRFMQLLQEALSSPQLRLEGD